MEHTRPPAQFPSVQQLSPRHPHLNALTNSSDMIERFLREDGHRAWGLVIYRSSYQNEAAWDEFMRRLLANTTKLLELGAGPNLLDNLALTVFDDPSKFNNATTAVVRDHFKQWAATMEQEEQGPISDPNHIRITGSQRYRYCIQVTQEALGSALADDREKMGFVYIIQADWKKYSPYENGERFKEEEEAIEGCTLEDVGWMKVPFASLMPVIWRYLRPDCAWEIEYRRPPEMSSYP
ncbi:uncharacterized protein N7482_002957 [Penicillium canariense]|uniref:Uncharacterized protein n=1 Tax=Penicillium canariense TaxID=189055 RepID=A0A9W9LUZ6_9EURO|nr:uncharacterized protein N7482_002957 [Penicillium canariense]KAJ5177080.1 hypothetical protein N7482_002957 [Penicillium canariense]